MVLLPEPARCLDIDSVIITLGRVEKRHLTGAAGGFGVFEFRVVAHFVYPVRFVDVILACPIVATNQTFLFSDSPKPTTPD